MVKVLLHGNLDLDHSRVPRRTQDVGNAKGRVGYFDFIKRGGLREVLDAVKVPLHVSTTGMDLLVLKRLDPKLLENLNPNVIFTKGPFSHIMPSAYPGLRGVALSFGDRAVRECLGNRVSPIGFVSEYDFWSGLVHDAVKARWEATLVNEEQQRPFLRHELDDGRSVEDIVRVMGDDGQYSMPTFIARSNEKDKYNLSGIAHEVFSGLKRPEEFVEELRKAVELAGQRGFQTVTFLTDLEVILLSQLFNADGTTLTDARLDTWIGFQEALANSGLEIEGIRKSEDLGKYVGRDLRRVILPPRDLNPKWTDPRQDEFKQRVRSLVDRTLESGDSYKIGALLIAVGPYAESAIFGVLRPPAKGKKGRILDGREGELRILPDMNRYLEQAHILHSLEQGHFTVSEFISGLPKPVQEYLTLVHDILREEVVPLIEK
ncbi:MAG: hypothetical protein HYS32_00400 [Candidatus Woesearchaeota archaeon]|nr:MAG: hypothetical protein HYS32_00400 [Candidatus Woesearchaeota archaeon]